ncbi:MAG: MGMT family protein [Halobaculum sp.]
MTDYGADAVVAARDVPRFDCAVQIGVASSRVIAVSFPDSVPEDATRDHPVLDRIERYADGAEESFTDVSVAFTVPGDHRAVLEAVREIPYGRTVDPGTLARTAAGVDGDDGETVRAALDANPAPLLVPDHRVRGVRGATPTRIAAVCREIEGVD